MQKYVKKSVFLRITEDKIEEFLLLFIRHLLSSICCRAVGLDTVGRGKAWESRRVRLVEALACGIGFC